MTNLNLESVKRLLEEFRFNELFTQELQWDKLRRQPRELTFDDSTFTLKPIAEKRGFQIFECAAAGNIPLRATRMKIDREVTKQAFEHLIVFVDAARRTQIWRWEQRDEGRPRTGREEQFAPAEGSGERLAKKLERLAISLEEEERTTLQNVTTRARAAFNVERVTKKFYERFKKEHEVFLKLISGIDDAEQQSWYASLMLNRLMFVYFIQHKKFLDGDKDYLQHRLARMQAEHGADKFYSFYKFFLLRLFHDGLGRQGRTRQLEKLLGKVPYLNGGLFDVHRLEAGAQGRTIEIPDQAFARVFKFFDEYDWLLDDRPLRDEREINPDVLGYIFEKYINQKQMGAYYTKEDITGYISQNTIIPFLFDRAQKLCANAFDEREGVWRLLREQPDRYLYAAVRQGVIDERGEISALPAEICAGVEDVTKRVRWNTAGDEKYALPTETWREHVARRERCLDVRARLQRGEVSSVNDLITLNLDIRQFAQDILETYEGSDLIAAFYRVIAGRVPEKADEEFEQGLSVLDPTAGSGAFLFSALNVLEPLVETCIRRMRAFVEEADGAGRAQAHPSFRRVLAELARHPNAEYFILKSIIIGNLYGVDIMEEATELCKLRLFLKLVAQIERDERRENMGLETLPDIDFNIRAGNTLVGFASLAEVNEALSSKLDFSAGEMVRRIEEDGHEADRAYKRFRRMQTVHDQTDATPGESKQELGRRLDKLADTLDRALAEVYDKDPHQPKEFEAWRKSHQPFHWFTEFYGIIHRGGFDVIIGNPPYVEYKDVREEYRVRNYATAPCGDLYAFVMERAVNLLDERGRFGMIVPVSIASADGFDSLRQLMHRRYGNSWILNFAERPSKLFTGVEKRLTIWLASKAPTEQIYLSNYKRWLSEERQHLFSQVAFVPKEKNVDLVNTALPKVANTIEQSILTRISGQKPLGTFLSKNKSHVLYYTRKLRYFVQFFDFVPRITDAGGKNLEPSELKEIYFNTQARRDVALAVLNSNLFFWFFNTYSDVRNVNRREMEAFRCSLDTISPAIYQELQRLSKKLSKDFDAKSRYLTNNYGKFGVLTIQSFQPRLSKPIIDEIDRVLAAHYGFTDEELDFIINYDIKYRMGNAEAERED